MSSLATIKELLTFKAFRPDPLDPVYTLKSRLSSYKDLIVINMGGIGVEARHAKYRGSQWEIVSSDKVEGASLTPQILDQAKDMAQSSFVVLSYTPSNLLCELENGRLPDDEALQKAMLTNPRSILRNHYEQDRRYQLISSSDRKKYLSFSITSRDAVAIEKMIKDTGLELVRLQIGLANMAELAIHRLEGNRRDGNVRMILVGDQSMMLALAIRDGSWEEPFSFVSRSTSGGTTDALTVGEFLDSVGSEINDPDVEFHVLHSSNSWWMDHAVAWFEKNSNRFIFNKIDDVPAFIDFQLAIDS